MDREARKRLKKLKLQRGTEAKEAKRNQADQPTMWEYFDVDWSDCPSEDRPSDLPIC